MNRRRMVAVTMQHGRQPEGIAPVGFYCASHAAGWFTGQMLAIDRGV